MNGLYKKAELLSNIAIIIVAILLGFVVVKRYIIASPSPAEVKTVSAGAKISVPNVSWEQSRRTLLVVLSQGCHFCSESVPFYQRLTDEANKTSDVRLVAVLPQTRAEGQKYLADLGLQIKDVEQAELNSIQVAGTPTLILVDNKGVVTDAWVGKLPADKETEVMDRLRCENCGT